MKGIVHFLSGLAVATFFPEAVTLAAAQSSLILVLGGIGGLLPDTLDFRLSRFMERPDVDIDPHPAHPNPQEIAEGVAEAINRAAATKRKLVMQLRTMRLGPDRWRQYSLRLDVENRMVIVKLGPVVNTSQMWVPDGEGGPSTAFWNIPSSNWGHSPAQDENAERERRIGCAQVNCQMLPTYGEETLIDIFGGPSFALEWRGGQVEVDFIPWHRQWSHSLTCAALFGLLAGVLFGATAGAITALAYAMHIAEDQLGFLGSNLFFPFTRRRVAGLKWVHSGDAAANFFTVWTMLVIILFNLDRFSTRPLIDPLPYFGIVWLPVFVLFVAYLANRSRVNLGATPPSGEEAKQDLVEEAQQAADA
jgi:membrane-bound metal-dependent hydrolase YbcI (DUF457 family)